MVVRDVLNLAKATTLKNLAINSNKEAMISLVYLGVSELYRKFNLSLKQETVRTNKFLNLYTLRNSDVSLILSVYDEWGRELLQTDVYNSSQYDYKIVSYNSFILRNTKDGILYAVYRASPVVYKDEEDIIDIPESMIDALLAYMGYMAHNTTNRDNSNESSVYLDRFNYACRELENQGYKIPLTAETVAVQSKGFV